MAKNIRIVPSPITGDPYILFENTGESAFGTVKLSVLSDGNLLFSGVNNGDLALFSGNTNLGDDSSTIIYGDMDVDVPFLMAGYGQVINVANKSWDGSSTNVKGPTAPTGQDGSDTQGTKGPTGPTNTGTKGNQGDSFQGPIGVKGTKGIKGINMI